MYVLEQVQSKTWRYRHGDQIGNIASYTGRASEYRAVTRAEAVYFQMLNDRGGVNGRKVNFISLDNGSNNDKSVDLARFRDRRAKPGRQLRCGSFLSQGRQNDGAKAMAIFGQLPGGAWPANLMNSGSS